MRLGPEVDGHLSGNMADPAVAQHYMATAERIAKCYRETIGPLPPRTVLFGNDLSADDGATEIPGGRLVPLHAEAAHHLFHAYSFWPSQSKLSFQGGEIEKVRSVGCREGLHRAAAAKGAEWPHYATYPH